MHAKSDTRSEKRSIVPGQTTLGLILHRVNATDVSDKISGSDTESVFTCCWHSLLHIRSFLARMSGGGRPLRQLYFPSTLR